MHLKPDTLSALGLHHWQLKSRRAEHRQNTAAHSQVFALDAAEQSLLINLLNAIGEDYDPAAVHCSDAGHLRYLLPNCALEFAGVDMADTENVIYLSRLEDMLKDASLKRPVWNKLKRLK